MTRLESDAYSAQKVKALAASINTALLRVKRQQLDKEAEWLSK